MRPLAVAVVALARVCGAEAPCDTPHACEPVILVPGIMGSRLRQHSREPGTLKTVTKHTWLPESHRLLTRSAVLGPVSSAGHSSWVNSLSSNYRRPGLRIEPDRSNWGLKGVSCILKTGNECVASAKVFWDMVQALEKAGYRAGSTLYGVPFDWRLPPTENKLCADLARVLHHVTNTTHHRKARTAHCPPSGRPSRPNPPRPLPPAPLVAGPGRRSLSRQPPASPLLPERLRLGDALPDQGASRRRRAVGRCTIPLYSPLSPCDRRALIVVDQLHSSSRALRRRRASDVACALLRR